MGRDKALLPYRGVALAESVARVVAAAAGRATLVGNPGLYQGLGYPAIPDLCPGEGPLGGILTALHHTSADWNLITACDMPELSAEILRRLLEAAEESGAGALVPAGPSGRPEPLCAVYHRRSRRALEAAFARGVRAVAAALEDLHAAVFSVPELAPFQNVNTPEDWSGHAPE